MGSTYEVEARTRLRDGSTILSKGRTKGERKKGYMNRLVTQRKCIGRVEMKKRQEFQELGQRFEQRLRQFQLRFSDEKCHAC